MKSNEYIIATIFMICSIYGCSDEQTLKPPIYIGPDSVLLNNNQKVFLAGVNLPWLNYGHDFGQAKGTSGIWTHDGISSNSSYKSIDSQFSICAENGIKFLRCFLFCDGRAAPEFDTSGKVIGFDEYFYTDFDAFLSLSKKYDIKLIVVLLDYLWLNNPVIAENGIRLGGHSDIIIDPIKTASFLDFCLIPFLHRYGESQTIAAWELMNEPEWRLPGFGGDYSNVSKDQLLKFFEICISKLHDYSTQPVTLGSAKYSFLQTWSTLELDFYQIHSYDNSKNTPPFISKTLLNCTKPVIIGEFPTASTPISFSEYLDASWNYGYAGSFAWSINGKDQSSIWNKNMFMIFNDWIKKHNYIIN